VSYLSKVANFNVPYLHLAPPLDVSPFEFCGGLQHQKTRDTGLLWSIVCMILCLAISVKHQLVTDGQMTTAYAALAWHRAVENFRH